MWNFCPSLDAAYTLVVLFAITTVAHFIQAVVHKKAYCWVIIMSGTTQTLAYFFRILSILSPASFSDYAAWFILILLAPLFTNAFIYMMIGRMVWSYIPGPEYYEVQLGGLKCISLPWMLGKLSYDKWNPSINGTWQDFNYTVYGAVTAQEVTRRSRKFCEVCHHDFWWSVLILLGLHIYMIGVGIQQGFIFLFLFFAIKFHRTILSQHNQNSSSKKQQALTLIGACISYWYWLQ